GVAEGPAGWTGQADRPPRCWKGAEPGMPGAVVVIRHCMCGRGGGPQTGASADVDRVEADPQGRGVPTARPSDDHRAKLRGDVVEKRDGDTQQPPLRVLDRLVRRELLPRRQVHGPE